MEDGRTRISHNRGAIMRTAISWIASDALLQDGSGIILRFLRRHQRRRAVRLFSRNSSSVTQDHPMQTRTRRSTASFRHPFLLAGLDDALPAGEYDVDEDEQVVEGLSWIAWHRVATFIHLPARRQGARSRQMVGIDHADLEAALELDRQRGEDFENETQ
jgi:hypothetical protein